MPELISILKGQMIQGMNVQATISKKSSTYKPIIFLQNHQQSLLLRWQPTVEPAGTSIPILKSSWTFSFKTCLNPHQT